MLEKLRDKDFREALPYFVVGAAEGVLQYYVKPAIRHNSGKIAWGGLIGGVVAYDLLADTTLSEHVDTAIERYPMATKLAIGITALHLANAIPESIDPIARVFKSIKG